MYGGIRSGLAIRPFLHELGSVTVPAIISIPKVNQALDENGKPSSEQEERLTRQAKRLVEQVSCGLRKLIEALVPTELGESPDGQFDVGCEINGYYLERNLEDILWG